MKYFFPADRNKISAGSTIRFNIQVSVKTKADRFNKAKSYVFSWRVGWNRTKFGLGAKET
jgi:hypothetical protein